MEPRAFKPRKRSVRKELVCEKCGEEFTNTPLWAKHIKGCTAEPSLPKRTIDNVMASIREKNK